MVLWSEIKNDIKCFISIILDTKEGMDIGGNYYIFFIGLSNVCPRAHNKHQLSWECLVLIGGIDMNAGDHLHLLSIHQSKASILIDVSDYCVPLGTPQKIRFFIITKLTFLDEI